MFDKLIVLLIRMSTYITRCNDAEPDMKQIFIFDNRYYTKKNYGKIYRPLKK